MEPEPAPRSFAIRVCGTPVPQPRPRLRVTLAATWERLRDAATVRDAMKCVRGQAYTPKGHPVIAWRAEVRECWDDAGGPFWGEGMAIAVSIGIVTPRPQAKVWKRKPMPREWDTRGGHGASGDCDNFAKAILDALNGVAWRDDNQIVRLSISKFIASGDEQPGAFVKVEDAKKL